MFARPYPSENLIQLKMLTHIVFSAGLLASFLSLSVGAPGNFALGIVLSLLVNYVIDELGHDNRDGMSVRSSLTHSVFTAPMWGAGAAYVLWLSGSALGLVGPGFEWLIMVSGVLSAYSHLLLDSITEGGVYFLTKRIAIAHFSHSNPALNAVFVAVGLLLFVL